MTPPGRFLCVVFGVASVTSLALATPRARPRHPHGGITEQLDCSACHTPTGWRSLAAGRPGGGFDHDRTGFPLTGEHRHAGCTDCHRADQQITRRCDGCHEDAHQGRLSADCDRCHDAASWWQTDAIEQHRTTRLPLSGMHALITCSECHQRSSDRAWGSLQADCFACHADDYRRSNVHPVHVGSADGSTPPFDRNCARCHRATSWAPAIVPVGAFLQALVAAPRLDHDLRFILSYGPHRQADCGDCHARPDGRGPIRCIGCHAHGEAKVRAQHRQRIPLAAGRACLGCHPRGTER